MIIFKPHEACALIASYVSASPCIIEAGAFNGSDTCKMAALWPRGILHAFEPVVEVYEKLCQVTAHLGNVHTYCVALSDVDGEAPLYISEKPSKPGRVSQANSLHKPKERLRYSDIYFPKTVMVPTVTIDSWARQYYIEHVDVLWLDMQGHELAALKASPVILSTVKVIYLEVAFIEAYEHQPTKQEICEYLFTQNFSLIGSDFDICTTKSFFGNMLFVRSA